MSDEGLQDGIDFDCCPSCGHPFDDDEHQVVNDDVDAPCSSCKQLRADAMYHAMKEGNIL